MVSSSHLPYCALTGLALALAGCGTMGPNEAPLAKTEVVAQPDPENLDPIAAAAFWGTRFDRNPLDAETALKFSKALRDIESLQESLRVMQQTASRYQQDPDVLLEFGKALIANERAHEAVRPIEQAISLGKNSDWSAYSALGVAYDMTNRHIEAREQYDRALSLAPAPAKVLNNKGLSYALSGWHQRAEMTLREATQEGGTSRIRQNYALVLALGGDTIEAERLARSDLPPQVADGNVAYFQRLVSGPAYWGELRADQIDVPDFGDAPQTISTSAMDQPVAEPVKKAPPVEAPTRLEIPEPVEQPKSNDAPLASVPSPEEDIIVTGQVRTPTRIDTILANEEKQSRTFASSDIFVTATRSEIDRN